MTHTWAVIGFGGMGSWHCENIRERLPEIRVKGAYDIRGEALKRAEEKGLYVYESLEELLQDKEVDLVTIAVPNNFHKDLTIQCLRAGKNVICEKPVAMNAAELEEMIAVSKETGKLFSIHQNRRWDKDYRIIKEIVDSGVIGTPYFIESRVQGSRGAMFGWRNHKVNGGGMLLDWGVHLIDQMMNMIDSPVVSVCAHLQKVFGSDVDDNIKVFLRFENGVSATCEMSTNCFVNLPRWHMSCTDGTAVVEDWSCKGKMVQLNTDAQMAWDDEIVYTEAGPTRTMAPRPKQTLKEMELPEVHTDWSDYYKNILGVLDNGDELIVKPEQALRVMKVIDLLFRSEEEGTGFSCRI
ncbi:MAG: Gfo/Idh/MocA family protein [Massiliimalia sp.]|jgi:scyllo-inositol 2-dehydrogenase (NADP+)